MSLVDRVVAWKRKSSARAPFRTQRSGVTATRRQRKSSKAARFRRRATPSAVSAASALDPRLDQAEALLSDFARFWQTEPSPAERRKLLASLFDRIWQDSGVIVAVKPRPPFVRYFKTAERLNR